MLKEEITDLTEYEKKKKRLLFLAKAAANKKHNDYLLSLATKFQEAILLNIEKPVSMLKQMMAQNASLALYRNLDQLSKEDIVEIIKGKNLVELLEQLEKDDKSY